MTRLTIAWLMLLASILVLTACVSVLLGLKTATPEILGALGVMLGTLVVKGIYAIKNRNAPDAPTQ